MVTAALVTFAILLVAWFIAPAETTARTAMRSSMVSDPEVLPEAA